MSPMSDMKELKSFVFDNFLNIKILSAHTYQTESKEGKRIWLNNNGFNLSDDEVILVSNKKLKKNYAKPSDILIDDKLENITDWNNSGGVGILHTCARNTIKQLTPYV